MLIKQIKMGKRSVKSNAVRKFESPGKRSLHLRDTFTDESNDSGLGSDAYSSFPESNSSSDIDCYSSDSVDSGISEQSRLARCKRLRTENTLCPPSSYSILQVDSNLALSLNSKMHIQHTQSEINPKINDARSFDEPSAKWRKVMPGAGSNDASHADRLESRENTLTLGRNIHRFPLTPSAGLLNIGVLTEAFNCDNSIGKESRRNDFENRESVDNKESSDWSAKDSYALKGTPDHNPRNGDRIAALLSASTNSLVRKRPVKKPSLHVCFPSQSKDGKVELCILIQPEEQHRARYMTEGSRGSIKDEKGTGFPTVKLIGYNQPVVLQIFIGSDQGKIQPHLFYQACKVTGKNCTPCSERIIDGTCVIEINMAPDSDMTVSCDCIGILKERNVDVEQRLPYFGLARCKKRSTKCRMVFRVNIPLQNGNYETLQVASSQILCTQSPGLPEICKKSLTECPANGGSELFIIGKNFQKDAKIVFQELADERGETCNSKDMIVWEESVDPEKEFAHQSHLVCCVPPYRNQDVAHPVKVFLSVLSGGKSSEPHTFTYTPPNSVQKEKFDHSPMHQPGISSVALEINREFSKNEMSSPRMSPVMLTPSPSDCGIRSMLSPSVHQGGCSPPSQLSTLSIQMMSSPASSSSHSPHSASIGQSNMGSPFLPETANMSMISNDCNSMVLPNGASGCILPLEHVSHSSPNPSAISSPTHANLQLPTLLPPKEIGSNLSNLPSEDHGEVDLMSGINQLATEMVQAQENAASTQIAQMSTNVVNRSMNLDTMSAVNRPNASFSEGCMTMMNSPMAPGSLTGQDTTSILVSTCNGMSMSENNNMPTETTTVSSQNILPQENISLVGHMSTLLTKVEPLPTVGTLELPNSASLTSSADGFATAVCPSSCDVASGENNQLTMASVQQAGESSHDVKPCLPSTALLEGANALEQRQTTDESFSSNSQASAVHPLESLQPSCPNLIDSKIVPLIYSNGCEGAMYAPTTVPQNCLEVSQCNSQTSVVNHPAPSTELPFGITAGMAITKKSPASNLAVPPSVIKSEKPDRATDLSCFQQTMTLALSQLSEADLLSIINPSTFDVV